MLAKRRAGVALCYDACVNRRAFVVGCSALLLAACRGAASQVPQVSGPTRRVIVVGAGIAGLIAARLLADAGIEVVVLEARARVGGRSFTQDIGGAPVDVGAAWVHGWTGNPVAELAEALGLGHRLHAYTPRRIVDAVAGADVASAAYTAAEAQAELLYTRLAALRAALGPTASLQDAIDRLVADLGLLGQAERLLRFVLEQMIIEVDYGGPTTRTSLAIFDNDEYYGLDDHLLAGGYGGLTAALAVGLDIRLSQPVTAIEHDEAGVRVATDTTFVADRVIVTVPVGVLQADSIRFTPPLPAAKRAALARLEMSSLEKVVLRFPTQFWGAGADSAWYYLSATRGEFPLILDMSSDAGAPTLVLIHGGQRARDALDQRSNPQLVADALRVLAEVLGVTPPTPLASHVTRWRQDPYSRGSYCFPALGQELEDFEALAAPVAERVLFAGEGTDPAYFGTVHGALRSGIREATRLGAPELDISPAR